MKSSLPTTAIRCSSSVSSWLKTGTWYSSPQPSWRCWHGVTAARLREESLLSRGWAYYVGSTVIFTAGAGLSIAGMRGGMTRMTRPITLSNATLYTDDSGKANLILSNPFCILRTIGSAGSVNYKKVFHPQKSCRSISRPYTSPRTARR